ncbi:hypothetical protein [Paenibacillus guangzhouensis]|uniref:hypothetical protein n=1 Tax=Paenibacillus guangzhouensis TaxID=1473112 RepID=UPI0012676219|nr:hypothetical protein [Paenibacillus guangzhouensis]
MTISTLFPVMQSEFLDEATAQINDVGQEMNQIDMSRKAYWILEIEQMKQLRFEMERLLDLVRHWKLNMTRDIVNLIFRCMDQMRMLKDAILLGSKVTADVAPLLCELRGYALASEKNTSMQQDIMSAISAEASQAFNVENIIHRIQHEGIRVLQIQVGFASRCMMKMACAMVILDQIGSLVGEVLYMEPSCDEIGDDSYSQVRYIVVDPVRVDDIQGWLQSMRDVTYVDVHFKV